MAPHGSRGTDAALEAASLALRMQQPDEAERLASGVLKSHRGHPGATTLLAQALFAQGRFDDAIAPLQQAIRRKTDPRLETLLGSAFAAAGQTEQARELFATITARQPAFPPAFAEYARLLSKTGETTQACEILERALTLAPDETELKLQLAAMYLAVNARAKARAVLQRALDSTPDRADVASALARIMLLDGDYHAASDLLRLALARRPGEATMRIDLAICLFERGEREAGEAALRRALQDQPETAGRAIHALAAASHGRFFLRPSAVSAYLARKI